jgi:uncharacterized membrane protein YfcA
MLMTLRNWRCLQTVVPMGMASIAGAIVGATFASVVPTTLLKIGLGLLLVISVQRVFRKRPERIRA